MQRAWGQLDRWDTENNEKFSATAVMLSERAQLQLVHLIVAMTEMKLGTPVQLRPEDYARDAIRHSADAQEHWKIPMYSAFQALGEAKNVTEEEKAIIAKQAMDNVAIQAQTDLALTQREVMSDLVETDQIKGYWRVPAEGSACDFCTLISDVLYKTEDLMPVHPGCECGVEPETEAEEKKGGFQLYKYSEEEEPEVGEVEVEEGEAAASEDVIATSRTARDDQLDRMNRSQAEAVEWYTGEGYEYMNEYLRTGSITRSTWEDFFDSRTEALHDARQAVRHMDGAFDKGGTAVPQDVTAYRGKVISSKATASVGDIIVDPAYTSTSTDRSVAQSFGSGGVVEMRIPAGQRYLVGDIYESEMILPRDTYMRVDEVTGTGRPTRVTVVAGRAAA